MKSILFRSRQVTMAFLLFMLAPLVAGILGIGQADESLEKRQFATWPSLPTLLEDFLSYPARVDAYLQDHYGMKRILLFLPALKYYIGGERVVGEWIIGKDRWLYTALDEAIPKHLGVKCLLPAESANLVQTALVAKEATEQQGGHFLVLIAPDKQSVYPEYLPEWLVNHTSNCDRYNQALEGLRSAGIAVVDARSVLLRTKNDELVFFKNDTHWNESGAYASYRAARDVFGWGGTPPTMTVRQQTKIGGDIAQALNVGRIAEITITYDGFLPPRYENPDPLHAIYSKAQATLYSHILPGAGSMGRVLLVGDSYSWMLRKFFLQEAAEVAWTDRRWGREQETIKKLHPDWVVMEFAERLI